MAIADSDFVTIPAVPLPFRWLQQPDAWESGEGTLSISAGPRCDLFVDPGGAISAAVEKPPMLVCEPKGDFALSARVGVEFAATYDAGVLVLFRDEGCWAKLCVERSPQGQPMVVSVVNRRVSDDCNHFDVAGGHVWFRIARGGDCFAFHASTDGTAWQLVRYFGLDDAAGISVGLEAQSPTGEGCRATFDEIRYEASVADLRSGG
jgi:regulation of enolase protein 1 (concanavalin A-like superfamily)